MFWESILLFSAFIVFAFDIIWQFWVAGMYAPAKARRFILNDDKFIKLEQKIDQFEEQITKIWKEIEHIETMVNPLYHDFNNFTIQIDDKLEKLHEQLRSEISGLLGQYLKEHYESFLNTSPLYAQYEQIAPNAPEGGDSVLPQGTLIPPPSKMEKEYQSAYAMIAPILGEDRADQLAYTYAVAPKILKKYIRKRIDKMIKEVE